MTNQNNAAQAANENPLSDEYVNAIIQRHGYDSPETVIARLAQWIGLNGGEDGVTLLMYEAHKALSKLRAPVADERAAFKLLDAWQAVCDRIVDQYGGVVAGVDFAALGRANRAALASAPVAGEAAYYAVVHGQALYGIFTSEAAAEACKEQGHPDAPFSVKPLYAAPQASAEDVRNAALEEAAAAVEDHQRAGRQWIPESLWGKLSREAAARIRALKQPQAAKDARPCSCPSGDGSLRHPCAVHPPKDNQ